MIDPLVQLLMPAEDSATQNDISNYIRIEEAIDCRDSNSRFFSLLNRESFLNIIISEQSSIMSCKLDSQEIVVDKRLYNETHETWAVGDRPYQKLSNLTWNSHVRGSELILSSNNNINSQQQQPNNNSNNNSNQTVHTSLYFELTRSNELNCVGKLKTIHLQHQVFYFNLNRATRERTPIDGHTLVVRCNGSLTRIQIQPTRLLCPCNKLSGNTSGLALSLVSDISRQLEQVTTMVLNNNNNNNNQQQHPSNLDDVIICDSIYSLESTSPLDYLQVQLQFQHRSLVFEVRSVKSVVGVGTSNSNNNVSSSTSSSSSSSITSRPQSSQATAAAPSTSSSSQQSPPSSNYDLKFLQPQAQHVNIDDTIASSSSSSSSSAAKLIKLEPHEVSAGLSSTATCSSTSSSSSSGVPPIQSNNEAKQHISTKGTSGGGGGVSKTRALLNSTSHPSTILKDAEQNGVELDQSPGPPVCSSPPTHPILPASVPLQQQPPPPAQSKQHQQQLPVPASQPERVSVGCQTDPNLIDKLIDNHQRKQLDDVDLYQEYVRSAECAQFWPLDKNPIRSLVPHMLKVDLPEQHLKNESLMFDLVQAITNNSKLVNLLAKYIHHIVPNVIISKRIDLIPLITCTIRVCHDTSEQERLISLLFNLIKRPNEEQRRMILSGLIVVLQVSPYQNSSLLLPNLWDHVNDKFPERRILLAESCASLAHYVRPIMRTNLILSILIQLLKDKNAAVRSAACKSFSCLLSLIMDRNDEVFDACLSATEDIIQDMLSQTPVSICEHRYELEQMRYCILETIFPLIAMWAVKLNRFKVEVGEFYLAKAERYFYNLLNNNSNTNIINSNCNGSSSSSISNSTNELPQSNGNTMDAFQAAAASQHHRGSISMAAAAVAKRRSAFLEGRHSTSLSFSSSSLSSSSFNSSGISCSSTVTQSSTSSTTATTNTNFFTSNGPAPANLMGRRQSAFVGTGGGGGGGSPASVALNESSANASALITSQRAINAYLRMLNYMVPFVFSDAVHSCAWLTKSKLHLPEPSGGDDEAQHNSDSTTTNLGNKQEPQNTSIPNGSTTKKTHTSGSETAVKLQNKLLEPTLLVDESAIVAFHDQLEQEHIMIDSIDWILYKFLQKFLQVLAYFSHKKFYLTAAGNSTDIVHEYLFTIISSIRQLCLLFGKHLTRSKLRPLIKQFVINNNIPSLFFVYIASLSSFEPIEQQEYEEIVLSIRQNLLMPELTRNDVEVLAISIKIIATSEEQIRSPSTRQKFLTYILDALVNYSNQIIRCSPSSSSCNVITGEMAPSRSPAFALNNLLSGSSNSSSSSSSKKLYHRKDQSTGSNHTPNQTQAKEFMLIIFRHILTCLIDPNVRPTEWAHILVTKFLPLLILLANDSTDVYVCTYARLMCAQLVDTFDNYLSSPKMTQQMANSIMPALNSLKGLTEQIKASNLKRQIECLTKNINEKFFNSNSNSNNSQTIDENNNI